MKIRREPSYHSTNLSDRRARSQPDRGRGGAVRQHQSDSEPHRRRALHRTDDHELSEGAATEAREAGPRAAEHTPAADPRGEICDRLQATGRAEPRLLRGSGNIYRLSI